VVVPDPNSDLKGHPKHLYYTISYNATTGDVRICGALRGDFVYTSVTACDCLSRESACLPFGGGA